MNYNCKNVYECSAQMGVKMKFIVDYKLSKSMVVHSIEIQGDDILLSFIRDTKRYGYEVFKTILKNIESNIHIIHCLNEKEMKELLKYIETYRTGENKLRGLWLGGI